MTTDRKGGCIRAEVALVPDNNRSTRQNSIIWYNINVTVHVCLIFIYNNLYLSCSVQMERAVPHFHVSESEYCTQICCSNILESLRKPSEQQEVMSDMLMLRSLTQIHRHHLYSITSAQLPPPKNTDKKQQIVSNVPKRKTGWSSTIPVQISPSPSSSHTGV